MDVSGFNQDGSFSAIDVSMSTATGNSSMTSYGNDTPPTRSAKGLKVDVPVDFSSMPPPPPPKSILNFPKAAERLPMTPLGSFGTSSGGAADIRSGISALPRSAFLSKETTFGNNSQLTSADQARGSQKVTETTQPQRDYHGRSTPSPDPSEISIKEEPSVHMPSSPTYVPIIHYSDPDIICISDDDEGNHKDAHHENEEREHQPPPSRQPLPQTSSSGPSIPREPTTSISSARTVQRDHVEPDDFGHHEAARLAGPHARAAAHRGNETSFVHPGLHRRSLTDEDEMDDDRFYEQSVPAGRQKESRRERDFEDYEHPTSTHDRQYVPGRNMHAAEHGVRPSSKPTHDYTPGLARGRFAASTPRIPGTPSANDFEIQQILGDKFRRAQILEEELARMQSVFLEIDDKLTSISEKDQELVSLRDRCKRFQDSLNDNKDKQLVMKDEIDKLRFQLHTANDEVKRSQMEAEHRLARAAAKQEMSDRLIKQFRASHDLTKETMQELNDQHKRVMSEVSSIHEERDSLKHRIRERDAEVEKIRWKLDEYRTMLQDQRAGYQDLRQDCTKVDEALVNNKLLRANLDDTQKQLARERKMVASLEASLRDMTTEIEKVREAVNNNHDDMSERITTSVKAFEELLSSQEGNFAKSRDLLHQLQFNGESPDSKLFKTLDSLLTTTDFKWTEVKDGVSKLCQEQEEASRVYAEKYEKWKAVKESLARQIETQTAQLKEQTTAIGNLEKHKLSLSAEVDKQKELNQCLVETKNEEQKLMQAKLSEVTHNYELSESNRREFVVRVSLLESSVNTLNGKLKAEREEADAEKKSLKETTEKYREEIASLNSKFSEAKEGLTEISELRQHLQKAKATETELEKSLQGENQKVAAAAKLLGDLRQQLIDKDKQLSVATSKFTDTSVQQSRLRMELTALRGELQLSHDKNRSQVAELDSLSREKMSLEAKLEERAKALERHEKELSTIRSDLKNSDEQNKNQKSELDRSEQLRESLQQSLQKQIDWAATLQHSLEDMKSAAEISKQAGQEKDKKISRLQDRFQIANIETLRQNSSIEFLKEQIQELQQEIALSDARQQSIDQENKTKNKPSEMNESMQEGLATTSRSSDTSATKSAADNEKTQTSIILINSTDSQEELARATTNAESLLLQSQKDCPVIEDPDFDVVPATQDQLLAEQSLRVAREAMKMDVLTQNVTADLVAASPERELANPNPLKRKRAVEKKVRFASQVSQKEPWDLPQSSSPQASLQYNAAKHRQKPDTESESTGPDLKKHQYTANWVSSQGSTAKEPKTKITKPEESSKPKRKTGPAAASAASQNTRKPRKSKK
ncbi:hypothetical protein ABW21_db0205437 [Orbilia brochopaga]|nr:hypothetical protein ABW21_db0205437 [Drechslerella brochopaga]